MLYLTCSRIVSDRRVEYNKTVLKRSIYMRIFLIVAMFLFAASLTEGSRIHKSSSTAKRGDGEYIVKSGDSLFLIAIKHHISLSKLCEANGVDEEATIRIGQKLIIPSEKKSKDKKTETASKNSSKDKKAARDKKVAKSSKISSTEKRMGKRSGKSTKTKGSSHRAKKGSKSKKSRIAEHKVASGETLYIVAHKYHSSIEDVRKANGLEKGAIIKVGQILKVPVDSYHPERGDVASKMAGKSSEKPRKGKKREIAESGKKSAKKVARKKRESTEIANLYEVQRGDNLFLIARKNHVSLKELMEINSIGPTQLLKPGQKLKLPSGAEKKIARKGTTPKRGKSQKSKSAGGKEKGKSTRIAKSTKKVKEVPTYRVKRGDTLWKIAKKHKLSVKELKKFNSLGKKVTIREGMVLKLSKPVKVAKKSTEKPKVRYEIERYTVKKGDSLWKIAKKHGVTVSSLKKLNDISSARGLKSGMVLTLSKKEIPISQKPKKISKKSRRLASAHKKGRKKASKSTKRGKKHIASAKKRKKRSRRKSVRNGHRINSAIAALKGSRGSSYSNASSKVIRTAKRYLGRRYVWGATGPSHFDCSGFTQYVMRKSKGIKIPRVSRMQAYYGKYVSRKNLKPGDLIFFDTSRRRRGYVNHVGIYIGNDKFIHASSARHRVVITSLNRPFYRARFKWGRRID